MTGADSAAVWTDFVPEAIHNSVAIKLLDICTFFYIITCFVFTSY